MSEYTKGEWLQAENDATFIYALNSREENQFWLKLYGQANGADEKELIANAHLIAACPELYELLKESQETIGGDWRERRDKILAKAEGKS